MSQSKPRRKPCFGPEPGCFISVSTSLNTETILRNSGGSAQTVLNIAFPTYIAGDVPPEAATASSSNAGSIYLRSSRLVSPYNINSLASLEQALPKGWRFAASADTTRGVHLIRTRNTNAPFPGTPLPDDLLARLNSSDPNIRATARTEVDQLRPYYPAVGNLYQFESSASTFSKNFTIRLYTPTIGLPGTPGTLYLGHFAFGGTLAYTRGYSYDDLGTAPNQYDFSREWARSQYDQRNRIQAQFQVRPTATVGLVSFNISQASGRPYSVTTGMDNNGDQSSTDRFLCCSITWTGSRWLAVNHVNVDRPYEERLRQFFRKCTYMRCDAWAGLWSFYLFIGVRPAFSMMNAAA